MTVLYISLPVALLLGGLGLLGCIYCIWTGQYDNLESDSMRLLHDEPPPQKGTLQSSAPQTGAPRTGKG